MAKNKRDKTTGLPLPSPVVPTSTLCFTLQIPNALEYRTALKGALSELGKWWNWAHTEGEGIDNAETAAQLWRAALEEASYQLDCGEDVNCDDVANCINTSPAVRAAIGAIVPTVPIDGLVYPPGTPLTPSQMTARLNEIDECAFDPYWAQVEQFVEYIVQLGQDVLEQIALYSAALDAGENVPMGQFLGKLKNSSTAGKVVDFLQWVLEVVKSAYEAQNNEANRDAIKCAIFCANRDACLITIQGVLDVLNERLGGILVPSDLTDLPSMVDAFIGAAFDPALTLDLWITFLMGSAKTAGMFGLQGIDETLNMVLAAAVNDANNDWETKCDDCPPVDDWITNDFSTGSQFGWASVGGEDVFATWSGGGWLRGGDTTQIAIFRSISGVVTDIELYFDAPLSGSGGVIWAGSTGLTGLIVGSSSDQQKWVWTGLALSGGIGFDLYRPGGFLLDQQVVKVRYKLA